MFHTHTHTDERGLFCPEETIVCEQKILNGSGSQRSECSSRRTQVTKGNGQLSKLFHGHVGGRSGALSSQGWSSTRRCRRRRWSDSMGSKQEYCQLLGCRLDGRRSRSRLRRCPGWLKWGAAMLHGEAIVRSPIVRHLMRLMFIPRQLVKEMLRI